ncbi:LruC domain-containing protein [Flammeovirga yaeyamensis]|uniref:LruC domain-containing protein n=1 Tax=Flammeovirga yaeyamensis TaxID=367791 RepID=A0AAX1N8F0_9BACT|nr:LruC domain-containing protein [Flammeovirga yaeyamensis]MBB3700639.1 LruC domain-containing protein [Flammeovirga yaeyamensis]NMF37755.1 LruC domain-containing protein [Flammeovirga yaeyamensis]QWG02063.1 LruC domain-containing protein [Flammeovirga yaeyamensis]
MNKIIYLFIISSTFIFSSCVKDLDNQEAPSTPDVSTNFSEIDIPFGFNFNTSKRVALKIKSTNFVNDIIYSYYFLDDGNNKVKLGSGFFNGEEEFTTFISLPTYVKDIYVQKNAAELQWVQKINIVGEYAYVAFNVLSKLDKTFSRVTASSNQRGATVCEDYLVATNGKGKSFTIHQENNYSITDYADIEAKSWAMAYDQENNIMYYDVKGKLYKRTLGTSTSTLITTINTSYAGLNDGYPRMTFKDGMLYIGGNGDYAILDAQTGNTLKNISVTNFPNNKNGGGDLVFDSEGDLYQACSGGLYRLEMNADTTVYNAVRLSADDFPYYLTGIAIDRFDYIYASTNESNSKIIKLDKQDGSFAIVDTLNRTCNDLAAFICDDDDFAGQDSDGDGVNDGFDEYPNDPDLAFNNYIPGTNGFGSYAFEDYYPVVGDYDFNDVIVNYRHNSITNANNLVVKLESKYIAKSVNASFNSGFAIEFPIKLDSIANVTGSTLTSGIVTLNAKGTETGVSNDKPVVVVFDNQNSIVTGGEIKTSGEMDMVMTFTQPITTGLINFENLNPFIFVNERSREVHLSGKLPTQKFDANNFTSGDDIGSFKTSTNHPWALSIAHTFHPPKENIDITNAYNNFSAFATSGGTSNTNWYTDDTGNRNEENIHLDN